MVKKKIGWIVCAVIVGLLVVAAIGAMWFTPIGYRMTVGLHGFNQIEPQVYVDRNFTGDTDEVKAVVSQARTRVKDFFGEVESRPVVIICDDKNKIARLGGDHDTTTVAINGAHSYISMSSQHFSVDILAHEMTHAETHARVYRGKWFAAGLLPAWFDEGLAVQNDYREHYTEQAWQTLTDNGQNVPGLETYDTPEEFYGGSAENTRKAYCLAGHEVRVWIDKNGVSSLCSLLDDINQGKSFPQELFVQ